MTPTASSRTDLMYEIDYNSKFVPLQSPRTSVKSMVVEGKPSYLMKNHATGKYYDLDEVTNLIWNLIDGKRTVPQIVTEVQRQKPHVQERTIIEMLLFFAEANLLVSTLEQEQKKRFKVVSPFEIDYTLIRDCNSFFQSLHSKIKPIFRRFLLWAVIVLAIVCAALFASEFVSIYGVKANFEIMGSSVVGFLFYYFVAMAPIIAIHEIAHTITLVHYGGKAAEIGTGLFYFGPMFYTDTTDAWGFRRRHRIMVYLAGNVSTLFIGSILFIVHRTVSIPEPASHILLMVAFYCFLMSLTNFGPPFETDGYYILSDIVNVLNLRQDSYSYLGSILRRALGRKVEAKIPRLTKRKKRIFLAFAVLSLTWIIYIVFQTSLFLFYMSQDLAASLTSITQSIFSSQAVQISTVIVAFASVVYFGMQALGYGYVFSAAVKKATAKPLRIDAVHDRHLAVFAYLPPQAPESLSNTLRSKMAKIAKKFTASFEVKPIGRSCMATLKMGATDLALVQIGEHLKRIENQFNSAYQSFILRNKDVIFGSAGIYAPQKVNMTNMFRQLATESFDAGNSSALPIAKSCEETQKENILYLLKSASGTVWTLEVQPAQEYDMEKELVPSLLLEDITLTDLYHDTESFKKRVVYGYDSLANLATDIDTGVRESLARQDKYQITCVLEPIKGRIILVGRTEQIEKNIDALAPVFVAHTWSGYLDNLLCETCFKLTAINRAHLPSAKEIGGMSVGEVTVLMNDLSAFGENQQVVHNCIEETKTRLAKINEDLIRVKDALRTEKFKIGMLDAALQVNVENRDALPGRINELQKEWKTLCGRIGKIREHVENRYKEKKPVIAKKKRRMLLVSPFIIILFVLLLTLSFQPLPALWSIALTTIALGTQIAYWTAFYHMWRSFHKVSRYASQPFNAIHLTLFASTEAVYGYVATSDAISPV